jgi:molybdate transport system substrate-binding protein
VDKAYFKEKICMKKLLLYSVLLLCLSSAQAGSTPRPTITVSAAASMKDALIAIAKNYRGANVRFNFAASGTLQRQIENGAPVDVFISAAEKNMDELQNKKLIEAKTRRDFARNRLVLIVPKNSKLKINAFADLKKREVSRVAIGAPASVPAGKYAQQLLTKIGLWEIVQRKAVRAKDVRGVLTQVEQGNVDAGIVYHTDALISKKVRVVSIAPENLHAPIRYPVAVVARSQNKSAARKFAAYLASTPSQKVLQRFGFITGN